MNEAVAALHLYANKPGPSAERAGNLYRSLRVAVMRNVLNEFHRTGHFWEQ